MRKGKYFIFIRYFRGGFNDRFLLFDNISVRMFVALQINGKPIRVFSGGFQFESGQLGWGRTMRLANICTSGAIVFYYLIQAGNAAAQCANGEDCLIVASHSICVITDEAKCWSHTEIDEGLSRIFCDGGSPDKACSLLEPSRTAAVLGIENPARPAAVTPASPKLDASGVPEFNAFEEGCDD